MWKLMVYQRPIADAVREMLETFRLPGESQQINRITETFAEVYFGTQPGIQPSRDISWRLMDIMHVLDEVKSQDAVYVLAYSIILLNTDLHNPQVKVRIVHKSTETEHNWCMMLGRAEKDDYWWL